MKKIQLSTIYGDEGIIFQGATPVALIDALLTARGIRESYNYLGAPLSHRHALDHLMQDLEKALDSVDYEETTRHCIKYDDRYYYAPHLVDDYFEVLDSCEYARTGAHILRALQDDSWRIWAALWAFFVESCNVSGETFGLDDSNVLAPIFIFRGRNVIDHGAPGRRRIEFLNEDIKFRRV